MEKALNSALKINPKLFAKKEEDKNKKRNVDAGKLLEDGAVTVQKSLLKVPGTEEPATPGSPRGDDPAGDPSGPYRTGSSSDMGDLPESKQANYCFKKNFPYTSIRTKLLKILAK